MSETIEVKKLTDLTPDSRNANTGTERGLSMLEKSIRQRGAGRSILLDKNGRIIAGNKTHQTAADIGLEDVIIVRTKGDKLVAVLREDLDLADDETGAREMAYADNRVGEVDLAWSAEQVLADVQAGIDLSAFWSEKEIEVLLAGVVESDWDSAFDRLPDQERSPFQQMTFTLHDSQAEAVKKALQAAKQAVDFSTMENENSNGNALTAICEAFVRGNGQS